MTRSRTMAHPQRTDPTRVTAQPALTTSDGREWLLVGTALAAVSLAVLLPLSGMHAGVALTGAGAVLLILIALGVVLKRKRRPRSGEHGRRWVGWGESGPVGAPSQPSHDGRDHEEHQAEDGQPQQSLDGEAEDGEDRPDHQQNHDESYHASI